MTRRHLLFACDGALLAATIDGAPARSGLLIVSGGNELRCGPAGSHAQLADRIAGAGFPVFRFDRRGVGDSAGDNAGFRGAEPDIVAAIAEFRRQVPRLRQIVAFGNCDAASALMLAGGAGSDAMVLANPWTFDDIAEPADDQPVSAEPAAPPPEFTPQGLRSHYLRRLADPRAIWRLLTGRVEVGQLASSLREAVKPVAPPTTLVQDMATGLAGFAGPVAILAAEDDRTAQAFLGHWPRDDARVRRCPGGGHAFATPPARIWLQGQILAALRGVDVAG